MEPQYSTQNQQSVSPQPHHWARSGIFLVFLLFILIGAGLVMKNRTETNNLSQSNVTTAPVKMTPIMSRMESDGTKLNLDMDDLKASTGKQFPVRIVADSSNKDVAGFDVLVSYDAERFDLVSVEKSATVSSFQTTFFTKKKGFISVTGTKNAGDLSQISFKNTVLFTAVLMPKKSGKAKIEINQTLGNEKTKIINSQSARFYPQVDSVVIEII